MEVWFFELSENDNNVVGVASLFFLLFGLIWAIFVFILNVQTMLRFSSARSIFMIR